jgi:hypothetical protein
MREGGPANAGDCRERGGNRLIRHASGTKHRIAVGIGEKCGENMRRSRTGVVMPCSETMGGSQYGHGVLIEQRGGSAKITIESTREGTGINAAEIECCNASTD